MSVHGKLRVGLIGARGFTGAELIRMLDGHPDFELAFASSRELAGRALADEIDNVSTSLRFELLQPSDLAASPVDACVLALPNAVSAAYVEVIEAAFPDCVIVDLSADHRFDARWAYGLPELQREGLGAATRIANPGCYATAAQLALAPVLDLVSAPPHCFGISGWSGAGTRPSARNDPQRLRDNVIPYAPVGHIHEREVSHHLGRPVRFTPHVAQFFRGISMTVAAEFAAALSADEVGERYRTHYDGEALVHVGAGIPTVADNVGRHHACVGGWHLDESGRRLVVFATLDNLLKGAATQALQNLNLALARPELEGIPCE